MKFKNKCSIFIHRIYEAFNDLNRELNWTLLARFGNTPFAKATLLAPILAQSLYHSRDIVERHVGIENAIAIYWSLIFISVGQIIYSMTCPREIKQYGNDIERFTIEAIQTKTEDWLENTFIDRIRSNYQAFGGTWISPEYLQDNFEIELRKELQEKSVLSTEFNTFFKKLTVDEIYNEYIKFRNFVSFPELDIEEINWQILAEVNQLIPLCTRSPVKPERYELIVLNNAIQEKNDGSWKFGTLQWVFYSHNIKLRWARILVAFFYVSGSLYLAFSALKNLYRMIGISVIEIFK